MILAFFLHKTYPRIVPVIVDHCCSISSVATRVKYYITVPAFITRTIYSAFVIWETQWENICEGDCLETCICLFYLDPPVRRWLFVCFIWIRQSDDDCLCAEQMLLPHCHQLSNFASNCFNIFTILSLKFYFISWSANSINMIKIKSTP